MSECPNPEKVRYRSRAAADKGLLEHERKHGIDLSLRPYRCECGRWHIGHRDKNRVPGWMRKR